MLKPKYNNFIFYTHNLGRYDIIFIYNVLLNYNYNLKYDYYILKTTMRDNTIIKLEIKIKSEKSIKIYFVDSLNLLNASLEKLTKEFKIENKKGNFPHLFVNKNTLNYVGNKPHISYYGNMDLIQYNLIPST